MRELVPLLLIAAFAAMASCGTTLHAEEKKDGQLNRARDEVRPKSSSSSSPSSPNPPSNGPRHDHPPQHYHASGGTSLWFGWFGNATVDDGSMNFNGSSASNGPKGLLAYPYADDQPGWLIDGLDDPADPTMPASVRVRQFGGAIRGEYTDASDGLERYAGALQISFSALRLETELHRYIEHLPGDYTNTLTLGTVGLALALPIQNSFTLLLGGGISTYHDSIGNESGWYLKAGAEMFPIRPLILHAEVWGGFIREDEFDTETFMGGGRATAGVIWNRIEVFGGWQAIWIDSVTLDGPTVGLRVWF